MHLYLYINEKDFAMAIWEGNKFSRYNNGLCGQLFGTENILIILHKWSEKDYH